jgi:hypothetical protein
MQQDVQYKNLLEATNILFELQLKVPQTTRYIRTVLHIASGIEPSSDEVLGGSSNITSKEDRFSFYMQ